MSYDARPPGFKTPRRDDDSHLESDGDTVPPSSQISLYTDFRLSSPGPEFTSIHSRSDASLHDTGSSARDLGPPSSPASARPPIAPRSMRPYVPHDTREVTPPPTKTPTPDYLALAAQSPIRLEGDPSLSRKLLILDLNGTLLHRAAANIARRERRHPHHPGEPLLDGKPKTMDPSTRPLPRLRPVHPRPYMPSFRNYLFTPQTKEWLDAMIWSSAQPYSVEDMVDKTFGETKEGLVAVWARDTLGLTAEQYNRKVQTFKDLTKPWAEIPSLSPHPVKPNKPLSSSSISSTPHNSPRPSSLSTLSLPSPPDLPTKCETVQAHSAMTTLLLDDSPRKAELQPYNHVCIPEYGGATRARDLVVLRLEKDREREEKLEDQVDASPVDSPMGEEGSSKKRKRKEKKRLKHAANHGPEQIYDETLIAVIGVLDEVKLQSNIAAWIRLGGLWGSPTKPSETPSRHLRDHSSPEGLNDSGIPEEDGYVSGGSDLSVDGTRSSVRKIRKKASPNDSSENKPPAGNDAVTSAVIPVVAKSSATDVELIGAKESPPAAMWFEDPVVMQYWVARGKKALERLGVALEHGIER